MKTSRIVRRFSLFVFLTFILSLFAPILPMVMPAQTVYAAGELYVKDTGTSSDTCADWDNACDLQTAITTAGSSGEIWVAAGTYTPTDGTDRTATFQLASGVAIYGGFDGTETSRDERDWEKNKTILSGEIDAAGTADNSYHVVTSSTSANPTDNTAILDGFTITAGNADGASYPDNAGGGVYNKAGTPTLTNLIITDNQSKDGGGMYTEGGGPTLLNVIFSGNEATGQGGGIYNQFSATTLTNVLFAGNLAASNGGGMLNNVGAKNLVLTNVTIVGNNVTSGSGKGGAMFNVNCNPTIQNSIIWGNNAPTDPQVSDFGTSVSDYNYSLVEGKTPSGTNLNGTTATPDFVAPEDASNAPTTAGDYRLLETSDAIDVGNNDDNTEGTDLDGNDRVVNTTIDLGAYEYAPTCPAGSAIFVDASATSGKNNGSTWGDAFTNLQDALTLASSGACTSVTDIWVAAGT